MCEIETCCNIINVFTVPFDYFNASVINKSVILIFNLSYPKHLNGSISLFPQKYWAGKYVLTLIIIRNVSYYYDFWRSCDTEGCSNDAENTDLITEINYTLTHSHRKQIF